MRRGLGAGRLLTAEGRAAPDAAVEVEVEAALRREWKPVMPVMPVVAATAALVVANGKEGGAAGRVVNGLLGSDEG